MSGIPAGAGSLLGKRLGKYEILALLALGGTAEIYLARIGGAAGFEKYVVVKCLHDHLADDQEFVKMFLDEARLAAHLDHSNIVQTMELGEHENRYYMVMEFLAGLSLAMVVRRAGDRLPGGRMPVPLVLNMIAQSCAGLHYAHERVMNGKALNIVHRDISPQNLVVSFEGVVKLVDFGIAKAELRETRTQSGTIKGKFAYMSPEQCVANNVDRRTDVFALGVITHEMITGRRLFKKASAYETYQAVIECAVEPPSHVATDIDPALDAIVMRSLSKDKEHRYPTAEAFGDAILGYLHHRGHGSGPGDVSRYFDTSFTQDIEEHGARMRELISGRVDAVPNWGGEEEDGKQAEAAPGDDKSMILATHDLEEIDPPSSSSLSEVIGDLGSSAEDMPADRTRIEANPLERLNELHGDQPKAKPNMPTVALPASGALPLPSIPTGPLPASPPRAPSGKFPEAANLPTMIAEPDPDSGPISSSEHETVLSKESIDTSAPASDANARTVLGMSAPTPEQIARAAAGMTPPPQLQRQTGGLPGVGPGQGPGQQQMPPGQRPPNTGQGPHMGQGPNMPPNMGPGPNMGSGPNMPPNMGSGPNMPPNMGPNMSGPGQNMPGQPPIGPAGYPVLSSQMRDQMASGATVFPSERGGSGPNEAQRMAADMVAPGADWASGGGPPVQAMPPWKLALLFVGALGGALLITILIALAAR